MATLLHRHFELLTTQLSRHFESFFIIDKSIEEKGNFHLFRKTFGRFRLTGPIVDEPMTVFAGSYGINYIIKYANMHIFMKKRRKTFKGN